MKKTLFILAVSSLLMVGCTALDKTNEVAEKVSTTTKTAQAYLDINSIKGKEFTLENSDITITFDTGKVYGFSGVNRYFGGVEIQGDKVTFTNLASTMMAGPEDKMKAESEYLKALNEMNTMSIQGNTVTLSGNNKTLKFIAK